MNQSKRQFLKGAAASAAGLSVQGFGLSMMALGDAAAANLSSGYRALVCIYLNGGNDPFNTIIPTGVLDEDEGTKAYKIYERYRTVAASPEPIPFKNLVLPKPSTGSPRILSNAEFWRITSEAVPTQFFMHPALSTIESLYKDKKAAVVANVGPLLASTSVRNFATLAAAGKVPANLFSHTDQTEVWLRAKTTETRVVGWGGALATLAPKPAGVDGRTVYVGSQPSFNEVPGAAAEAGAAPLNLASKTANGALKFGAREGGDSFFGLPNLKNQLMNLHANGLSSNKIQNTYAALVRRSLLNAGQVESKLSPSIVPPVPPGNQLADDLRLVAKMIKASSGSAGRQVFYVSLGSFDSHSEQLVIQGDLLQQLDEAIGYFQNALGSDLFDKVTTFTASEFGRKLVQNDNGTDHGWGSHHFVIGGAVAGGKVYGHLPDYNEVGQAQLMEDGVMIPTTSVGSYIWPMAEWFGVDKATVEQIFGYTSLGFYHYEQASATPLMRPPAA